MRRMLASSRRERERRYGSAMICSHADDDGESETRVEARLITALGGGGSDSDCGSSDKLREGDKVEADYRDRGKFYPGKITRDRGDETYDISYDDGEREIRVAKRLIRKKRGSSRSRSPSRSPRGGGSDRLREGDAVEADYRGRGRYYPGKISRDRGDDTYDIAYDDGERETRVSKRLIKKKGGGSRSPSPKRGRKLREGAKVQARYRGRSKFYPGRIERDHGDGTYDLAYVCVRVRNVSSGRRPRIFRSRDIPQRSFHTRTTARKRLACSRNILKPRNRATTSGKATTATGAERACASATRSRPAIEGNPSTTRARSRA